MYAPAVDIVPLHPRGDRLLNLRAVVAPPEDAVGYAPAPGFAVLGKSVLEEGRGCVAI